MKRLKRILFYIFLTVATLVIAGGLATYLYRDQIIHHFIREANAYLKTPVHTARPVISFERFPEIAILFEDVYIEESYPDSKAPLAKIDKVLVSFNPFDILMGDYSVGNLTLINGSVSLRINAEGEENYRIFENPESSDTTKVDFTLNEIRLVNINLDYDDRLRQQHHNLDLLNVMADMKIIDRHYNFDLSGEMMTAYIEVKEERYFSGKKLQVEGQIDYDDGNKLIRISDTILTIDQGSYTVSGQYAYKDKRTIELRTTASGANIQSLLSLLPAGVSGKLAAYRSNGNVYFNAQLSGEFTNTSGPELTVEFGSDNAEIYHPEYKTRLNALTFNAVFRNPNISHLKRANLRINDFATRIRNNPVSGSLLIDGFDNKRIEANLEGSFTFQDLLGFYPLEEVTAGSGSFTFDLSFNGNLNDLKNRYTARNVSTAGTLELTDIDLTLRTYLIPLQEMNGTLTFNNNDLAINNLRGKVGKSDFQVDGLFRNIISWLLFEDQPIGIEADLKSEYIDVDEILAGTSDEEETGEYSFAISPKLFLSFDCRVDKLKFRRFEPANIRGNLRVKDQLALGKDLKAEALGGRMEFTGLVDARIENDIRVEIESKLNSIHIDRMFYVFENFNQTWLIDDNLRGQLDANVTASMAFDRNLRFKSDRLVSDVNIRVINGELNNFEPMQRLAKYVEDENLSQLRFSELANDIHIENRTIYLPETEVRSNVTNIRILGTHTFDQEIDYHIIIPLKTWLKDRNDPAFGAVEEDEFGKSLLFLKIIGTTDDYRIVYDKEAVKTKILADLKDEVNELKDAFKNKDKVEESVGVNDDEYFEWDQ